jgi:hypothetical protein
VSLPIHDKAFWKAVAEAQYDLPIGYTVGDLTPELLGYLGSPDPGLRDEIAVETLTHWIIGGLYAPEALRRLMHEWTANLRKGIGEQGTNGVSLRSFSVLMLSIIAYHDWKAPFLTRDEVHALLDQALEYLAAEKDVRGYDEQIGWLHSPAHTADLLKFLARSPKTNADDHRRIIHAVAAKVTEPQDYVYVHSEYQRLGLVILDVVRRNTLDRETLARWMERFIAVRLHEATTPRAQYHGMYQNSKIFLLNLYFIFAHQEVPIEGEHDLQAQIFDALRLFKT